MNATGLLLHVSGAEAAQIQAGIRTALNARAQLPQVVVELVLQGACVSFLEAGSVLEPELSALAGGLVRVLACANSLRSAEMEATQLHDGVGIVPAAVAHLATRQLEGWAYVRV